VTTTPISPPAETAAAETPRGPLDPIVKPLWRLSRADRNRILEPFTGQMVRLERWMMRIASGGDQQYKGELLAVATSTIGSAADLVIIKTVEGNIWAISTAQVAYLELLKPPGGR
jgi:hypothetical protein